MSQRLYKVRQHYRYVYTGPVFDVKQRLVMIPPDRHGDQVLVSFDLDVRGTSGRLDIDWRIDEFGNRVCHVEAEHVEHAVDFEARFSVCRTGDRPAVCRHDFRPYLCSTALTAPNARIESARQEIARHARTPFERAERAHDWAAGCITYQVGVTGTRTPAAMALHLGQGVCQDYAHILLSLLRSLGIAARYVSGHLLGEGAPHAWVEALVDDTIVAYDPTHHRRTGDNYITVATGRDFADVSTTSGVFSGAAVGKLHWSKEADVLEDAA